MLESENGPRRTPGGVSLSFADRGLRAIASAVGRMYLQWETASRKGLMQSIHPLAKVLFLMYFALVVSFTKGLAGLAAVAVAVCMLAVVSRAGAVVLYRRALFLAFFFGFLVSLPSALNLVTDGNVILEIARLDSPYRLWIYRVPALIGVTDRGAETVARITLRVFDSVTLVFLVMHTTAFTDLLRSLRLLRVPEEVLMILWLTYKNIFIFAKTTEEMHLALKSRHAGGISGRDMRRILAGRMGFLLTKMQRRAEEAYLAMVARGYSGEIHTAVMGKPGVKDAVFAAIAAAAGAAVLSLPR